MNNVKNVLKKVAKDFGKGKYEDWFGEDENGRPYTAMIANADKILNDPEQADALAKHIADEIIDRLISMVG